MKFRKIMLITLLLLAVLTIGAASAAEDADALAVDETGDEQVMEAPVDDVVEEEITGAPADENLVEADESGDALGDEDIYIEFTSENITSSSDTVCSILDASSSSLNGNVTIFANDVEAYTYEFNGAYMNKDIRVSALTGEFNGSCFMKLVYSKPDGNVYSKNATVYFAVPYVNKALTPEDFNVVVKQNEFYLDDENSVFLSFDWPEKVTDWDNIVLDIEGNYPHSLFRESGETSKNITFGELYIFEPGKFNFTVSFVPNVGKTLALANGTLKVSKKYVASDFIELYAKTITDSSDYVCILSDDFGLNGTVTIYANNVAVFNKTLVTATNAGVKITPQNLTTNLSGSYSIRVVYNRNDGNNYSREATINFNIPKELTPEDFNVTIVTKEVDIDDSTAVILSFDWPNSIGRYDYVGVAIDGSNHVVSQSGVTHRNVTLEELYIYEAGDYNYTVTFYKNDGGKLELANGTLKVSKTYTDDDMITLYTYDVSSREDHIADVWDGETGIGINGLVEVYANNVKVYSQKYTGTDTGKPIAAKDLSGYFNGEYFVKVVYTRADGKTFSQNATIKFIDIVGVKVKSAITVSAPSSIVYNDNKYLVATLKDANGNIIANEDIKISLMGISYDLRTDKNGQIKQALKELPPKTHTITLTFESDKYLKSSKSVKVTVNKGTLKITAKAKTFKKSVKTKKYSITLKTNQNKVMKSAKVTIKVNKKTYSAKTNAKGVATFKITKLTKKGTYATVVKFAGNSYYKAKSAKAKIIVK